MSRGAGQYTPEQIGALTEYDLAEEIVTNPHPDAYCPHCGVVKACVAWAGCSAFCEMVLAVSASKEDAETPNNSVFAQESV